MNAFSEHNDADSRDPDKMPGEYSEAARNSSDDVLDQLLRDALWPEPADGRVQLLMDAWRRVAAPAAQTVPSWPSPLAMRAPWRSIGRAAAAVVLVALAGWVSWNVLSGRRAPNRQVARQPASPPEQGVDIAGPAGLAVVESPASDASATDDPPAWRPPTAQEMLFAAAARHRAGLRQADLSDNGQSHGYGVRFRRNAGVAATRDVAHATNERRDSPFSVWVEPMVRAIRLGRRSGDPWPALLGNRAQAERYLANRCRTSQGAVQQEAFELLAAIATQRSLPMLRESMHSETLRPMAQGAWLRLASTAELAERLSTADRQLQIQMVNQLWSRPDPAAWGFAIGQIGVAVTETQTVEALQQAPPEAQAWLGALMRAAEGRRDRELVARLLGRQKNPAAIQQLIALTRDVRCRQTAIRGLLLSRQPQASEYLAVAETDPYLVASIWNARRQQSSTGDNPWGVENDEIP